MLFDKAHIMYIVTALLVTIILEILFSHIKKEENKDRILKFFAIITVVLHFSLIWTSYFTTGKAEVTPSMLLPIFFCNFAMWMLLIAAFWKNKKSKLFNWIATFAAYAGIIGGVVTMFYPDFYFLHKSFSKWIVLRSAIDHTTMLIGSLYLFVGKYVKVRVFNVIQFLAGALVAALVGVFNNFLFSYFNLPPQNSMYLQEPAVPGVPMLSGVGTLIMAISLIFVITVIYEFIFVKKEDRWYRKMFLKKK